MADLATARTIPELYFAAAERFRGREMGRYYEGGVQHGIDWDDGAERVRDLAAGLLALGIEPGERIAILSETSHHWTSCDLAILAAGAVTLGIYPTSRPDEIAFVLRDAGARVAFVEDAAMAERVASLRSEVPLLERLVVIAPGGPLPAGGGLDLASLDELAAIGRSRGAEGREEVDRRRRAVGPEDLATLVYTSGTTGEPKGVELTHANLLHTARVSNRLFPMSEDDVSLVYLPLAHVLQRVTIYIGLVAGARGVYLESISKLKEGLAEVRPTVLAGVPRVYEKVHARIEAKVAEAPPRRQKVFRWALEVGRRLEALRHRDRPIPASLLLEHALADRLVLRRIREAFGGRIRYMVSGAAPMSVELLEFFRAAGLLVLEGYGLTETAAPVTVNTLDAYRFGSVGRAVPGCRVRIAADGEVLVTGPNVFRGYWRRPDADAESFETDGEGIRWFRTGDIGELDADGYLTLTDRKKNLLVTASGKNVAPQPIENALREHPLVEHACVLGDRRPYLVALLTLDAEESLLWARARGLAAATPAEIAREPALRDELGRHVDSVNARLARFETVKRHAAVPEGFSIEAGTLTPTLKLRRRQIERVFAGEIERLYAP